MAYSWSMEKTFRRIEFYEGNPCLYNTKEKQYHDRNLKSREYYVSMSSLKMTIAACISEPQLL